MSKIMKYVPNGKVTPDMITNKDARIPKEVLSLIKGISTANEKAEKASYTVAYNLGQLQMDRNGKKEDSFVKKMGYTDIRDYAETFHNISAPTAYAYAQTANEFLVKDEFGIHSPFFNADEDGKITADFSISQLQEMRGTSPEMLGALHDADIIRYGSRTKAIRFVTGIAKLLSLPYTGKGDNKKENPYFISENVAEVVAYILNMDVEYLLKTSGGSATKALEMVNTPVDDAEGTDGNAEGTDGNAEGTDDNTSPVFDTSDGTMWETLVNTFAPFVDYATENRNTAILRSLSGMLRAYADEVEKTAFDEDAE